MEHGLECGGAAYVDRVIAGGSAWFTDRLHEISIPALVLRGTEDRLVRPDAALELAGRIPGAEVALIDGGGHCCPHSMPGPTTRAIEEWLGRKGL
jgi:pimeloyl-ACP methyl ester carboxylesterase